MKSFTITFEAQTHFPDFYRVIKLVHDEKDMSGNVHKSCVLLGYVERGSVHEAIFDAVTGEYITED